MFAASHSKMEFAIRTSTQPLVIDQFSGYAPCEERLFLSGREEDRSDHQARHTRTQITGLSKLMAGDNSCLFRPWFKSWHHSYKRLSGGGEGLATWQARHSLAVHELADRLEREGCQVFIEDQNWFDTRSSASGSILTGKPDVIALHPDCTATVYDVKTGGPRLSDEIQVKLYVMLLPRSEHSRWPGVSMDGAVVCSDGDRRACLRWRHHRGVLGAGGGVHDPDRGARARQSGAERQGVQLVRAEQGVLY